jgi:hypothetical protein
MAVRRRVHKGRAVMNVQPKDWVIKPGDMFAVVDSTHGMPRIYARKVPFDTDLDEFKGTRYIEKSDIFMIIAVVKSRNRIAFAGDSALVILSNELWWIAAYDTFLRCSRVSP